MREETRKIFDKICESNMTEEEVTTELTNLLEKGTITQDDIKEYFQVEEDVEEDNFIQLNLENILNTQLDKVQFNKGLQIGSYYAGMYTALKNVGMSEDNAYNLVLNQNTSDCNKSINQDSY